MSGGFRTAGPLRNDHVLTPVNMEEAARINEAFRRGAKPALVVDWLWWRRDRTRPTYRRLYFESHRPGDDLYRFRPEVDRYDVAAEVYPVVKRAWDQYLDQIRNEFNSLHKRVRGWFADPDNQVTDHSQFYLVMRPLYYNLGYSYPARDIFSRLQEVTIFGNPCVVHSKFAEFLADVQLLAVGVQSLSNDGGFVPRVIDDPKNPGVLSNHAFGLALDLDASKNPMIAQPQVIQELNAIVREAMVEYQFDKKLSKSDNIAEIVERSKAASDAVRRWLDEYIYDYEEAQQEIKQGGPSAAKAKKRLKDNKNLARFDRLVAGLMKVKGVGTKEQAINVLRGWSENGIFSLDLGLVSAMYIVASQPKYESFGFRYLGAGETRKDFMHFEFQNEMAIPPDTSPRSLDDLLGNIFIFQNLIRDLYGDALSDTLTHDLVVSPHVIRGPR